MTTEFILITIVSSLISGLIGVIVSYLLFRNFETRKIKMQTAQKLFGNRHNIHGERFKEAMNEIMIVFSDCPEVMDAMTSIFKVVETPIHSRAESAADDALINFMKVICKRLGIKHKYLADTYYLKHFSTKQ